MGVKTEERKKKVFVGFLRNEIFNRRGRVAVIFYSGHVSQEKYRVFRKKNSTVIFKTSLLPST